MASIPGLCLAVLFPLLFSSSLFLGLASASSSPQRQLLQSNSPPSWPKNIETFFPSLPSPAFQNSPPPPPPPLPSTPPPPPLPSTPPPPTASPTVSVTSDTKVRKAVAITAASSLGLCGLLFVAFLFFSARRRREVQFSDDDRKTALKEGLQSKPKPQHGNGLIVDENGLDAIYWREFNQNRCQYCHSVLDSPDPVEGGGGRGDDGDSPPRVGMRIQERPLLPTGSISSSSPSFVSEQSSASPFYVAAAARSSNHVGAGDQQLPPPPSSSCSRASVAPAAAPPPPPPPAMKSSTAPPPPPPPPKTAPPPPPRPAGNNKQTPNTPPPPRPPGSIRQASGPSSRPPSVPVQSSAAVGAEGGQKKLKPLHWDKVNPVNAQHSMVWDKIIDGSFKFDEDIMEALFGTMATNRKSSDPGKAVASSSNATPGTPTQISLLDSRKSQNVAIVLRSLALSRQDILDALLEGRGLPADVLERLTKIAPTKEEEALVRDYDGNPAKLADAESFLFHILRAVPSPFVRFEAMLFKSNYELEVAHLKQSLLTLESACRELKVRGLFLKLLEAVLKAGNLMNAGTARGNAQAFNLTALCKLSDVKSTDGSTTLLHFVVEEVIRSEGKRLALNRNYGLRRQSSSGGPTLDQTASRSTREEREKEYIKLGLPIVGGISDEFSSAKKAAGIDYEALAGTCSTLGARMAEIRRFLETCSGDGFTREMRAFVEGAEDELRAVTREQGRVLQLVKSITEYYQPGAYKDRGGHPLQLFVIVRDFLNMVDKACVDIARNLQKKKPAEAGSAVRPGLQPGSTPAEGSDRGNRPTARFPYLPPNFMREKSMQDSSSDDER